MILAYSNNGFTYLIEKKYKNDLIALNWSLFYSVLLKYTVVDQILPGSDPAVLEKGGIKQWQTLYDTARKREMNTHKKKDTKRKRKKINRGRRDTPPKLVTLKLCLNSFFW